MKPEEEFHDYMPAHAQCPAWLEWLCGTVILACFTAIGFRLA